MSIALEELKSASEEAVREINDLLPQLRDDANDPPATIAELQHIVESEDVVMVVAKDGEKIIGMATLYIMQKLGKRTGIVEDVVVDSSYRGQGLGERVMQKLLEISRMRALKSISLTSRPSRIAGNKLYQKLGFQRRETNVYKLRL
jgi:ribosomal protein S18 acetylase RimI-like enzyme